MAGCLSPPLLTQDSSPVNTQSKAGALATGLGQPCALLTARPVLFSALLSSPSLPWAQQYLHIHRTAAQLGHRGNFCKDVQENQFQSIFPARGLLPSLGRAACSPAPMPAPGEPRGAAARRVPSLPGNNCRGTAADGRPATPRPAFCPLRSAGGCGPEGRGGRAALRAAKARGQGRTAALRAGAGRPAADSPRGAAEGSGRPPSPNRRRGRRRPTSPPRAPSAGRAGPCRGGGSCVRATGRGGAGGGGAAGRAWRCRPTCRPCRSCSAPTRAAASSRRTAPRFTPWPGAAAAAASRPDPSIKPRASSCSRRTGW